MKSIVIRRLIFGVVFLSAMSLIIWVLGNVNGLRGAHIDLATRFGPLWPPNALDEQASLPERGIAAQEWGAFFAGWAFIVTSLGIIAAIMTLRSSTESTRVTKEIGQKQARAYLVCDGCIIEIDRSDDFKMRLLLKVRNVGQSPAGLKDLNCSVSYSAETVEMRAQRIDAEVHAEMSESKLQRIQRKMRKKQRPEITLAGTLPFHPGMIAIGGGGTISFADLWPVDSDKASDDETELEGITNWALWRDGPLQGSEVWIDFDINYEDVFGIEHSISGGFIVKHFDHAVDRIELAPDEQTLFSAKIT